MPEHDNDRRDAPVTYASPLKRIWAWVGVAYMVIAVCLVTYVLGVGSFLRGIGGLMVCPALAGVAASLVHLWRRQHDHSLLQRILFTLTLGLCAALFVLGIWAGVPALIANFGVR